MSKYWKPSSSGTPTQSAAPSYSPTPAPSYQPQQSYQDEKPGFFEKFGTKLQESPLLGRLIKTPVGSGILKGLGAVSKVMNTPLGQTFGRILQAPARYTSGGVTDRERRQREAGTRNEPKSFSGFLSAATDPIINPKFIKAGLKNVFNPPKELDPWGGGFSGKGSVIDERRKAGEKISPLEKDVAFGMEILYPTLAELGAGKVIKAIPGVSKLSQQVLKPITKWGDDAVDWVKGTKLGNIIETLEPGFKSPGIKKFMVEANENASRRVNQLYNTIEESAKKLSNKQQRIIGEIMEDIPGAFTKADESLRKIAKQMNDLGDMVGRESVEMFKLTKGKKGLDLETFEKFKGKYLTHTWDELIKTGKAGSISQKKDSLFRYFQERKGKPGYRKEYAPATFKGLATEITANEIVRGHLAIAEKFGIKADEAKKLIKKYGDDVLKEFGYLPKDLAERGMNNLYDDVMLPPEAIELIRGYTPSAAPVTNMEKLWATMGLMHDRALSGWKLRVTIDNPAYHGRNIISNQTLAGLATGRSLPRTIVDSFDSLLRYFGKDVDKYVGAMEAGSIIKTKSLSDGLNLLVDESGLIQKGLHNRWRNWWKGVQNSSEDIAKVSVFKHSIDKIVKETGKALDDVLKDPKAFKVAKDLAEESIFSPYRIGSGERALMQRIVPFYSFFRQATPFIAKTAVTHPERFAIYPRIKQAVEGLSEDVVPDEDREDWQQGSVQLPLKSKAGAPIALDTSYLLPWGNVETPSASLAKGQLPGGLSLNPFVMEAAQQLFNKDLYFDQDIAKGTLPGTNLKDLTSVKPQLRGSQRIMHAANTLLGSLFRTLNGKIRPSLTKQPDGTMGVPDFAGRERDIWMGLGDLLGLKTTELRPERKKASDAYEKQKRLEEIESSINYTMRNHQIPPDQKKRLLDKYQEQIRDLFQ